MSQWELQVQQNANAIQQIINSSKKIADHPLLSGQANNDDILILQRANNGATVSVRIDQINIGVKKELFFAISNQILFLIEGNPPSLQTVFIGRNKALTSEYNYVQGEVNGELLFNTPTIVGTEIQVNY